MREFKNLNPLEAAAILVDLQKDYCDPKRNADRGPLQWDVAPADAVCRRHVPYLAELRTLLPPERIVWTRMEEAAGTYAFNNAYGATGDLADQWVPLCVRDTPGHDFHVVAPAPGEHVVFKVQHGSFNIHTPDAAGLHDYLKGLGVSQLIFSGVIASRCVNASVLGASALGYQCVLQTDLVGGPRQLEAEMREHLKVTGFFYANLRTSAEVLVQLRKKL